MNILFVTPYLPSPPRFGGQRRLDGLMRSLAKRHSVSVVAFNRTDEFAEMSLAVTREYCHEAFAFENLDSEDRALKRRRQLRSLVSRHSYEYNLARRRRDFQRKLDEVLLSTPFDVLQVEFCTLAGFDFSKRGSACSLVLDEHNIEYDLQRRSAQAAQGSFRQVYNEVNWRKLRLEERVAWRKFDGVVVTSARDEALLKSDNPSVPTAVVPNAADVEEFQPSDTPPSKNLILFFGALGYYPNEDGVEFFVDDILPLVRAQHPDAELCLVGPGAKEPVLSRVGPHVHLAGFVDDVQEYIDRAAVVIVPLRVGGGTRLKIVEAMAKGKAIVSTSLGAEGIAIDNEQHALIADGPRPFAEAVCRILSDRALAVRLGAEARKRSVEKYSWRAAAEGLEAFYHQLRPSR